MFDEERVIYRYKHLPFSDGALRALTEGTIKFTCPLEFNDPFDSIPHYDTTRERPQIQIGAEYSKDLVDKIILTKSADWAYEQEERVVDHIRGPGIFPCRRDEILCSIVAGLKMTESDYRKLREIVRSLTKASTLNPCLYRAEVIPGTYRITVKEHPRLSLT